jgi:hypothetical protein
LKQGARGSHGSGKVIDLGLRFEDIQGLQSEPVTPKGSIIDRLSEAGASDEEIEFLRSERVELNAMTSEEFVTWLEAKLTKVGVEKYLPEEVVIGEAYKRALYLKRLMEKDKELREEFKESEIVIPADLVTKVYDALVKNPENSWDRAIWNIVNPTDDPGPINPTKTVESNKVIKKDGDGKKPRKSFKERKAAECEGMRKEDEKGADSAADLGGFIDNLGNIKDPWKATEQLMNVFIEDFSERNKKH